MHILSIPAEVLELILLLCDPLELAALAQTGRLFRELVYGDKQQHIWRSLYLSYPLDDPRLCVDHLDRPVVGESGIFDWKTELQRIVCVQTSLQKSEERPNHPGEAEVIFTTLLTISGHYLRSDYRCDPSTSSNIQLLQQLATPLILHRQWILNEYEIQLLTRLHTILGFAVDGNSLPALAQSRAYIYNLERYNNENGFGPFERDGSGRVNYVHLNAIRHVISAHVHYGSEPVPDHSPDDLSVAACLPTKSLEPHIRGHGDPSYRDWIGVDGWWWVNFAFCDHRELLHFNMVNAGAETVDASVFEDPDFVEIYRSLHFKLSVTHSTENPSHPDYPDIFFEGELEQRGVTMRGNIHLTDDGTIRWHTVSGEGGNPMWSTEGVHIGHVRGSFGVLGIWTTVAHEDSDPVGPLWITRSRRFPQSS